MPVGPHVPRCSRRRRRPRAPRKPDTFRQRVDNAALLDDTGILLLGVGRLVRHRLASGGRARLRRELLCTEGWRCGRHDGQEVGASASSRVPVMELLCVGTKGWRSVAAATSRRRVPTAKVTFVAHLKSLCRSPVHSSYGRQPLYVGRYETYAPARPGRWLVRARWDACAGVRRRGGRGEGVGELAAVGH